MRLENFSLAVWTVLILTFFVVTIQCVPVDEQTGGQVKTGRATEENFWSNYWSQNLKPFLALAYDKSKEKLRDITIYLHDSLKDSNTTATAAGTKAT